MNNIIKKLENEISKIQCSNCRRTECITDNDEFKCKYHLTSIYGTRPKCKYFKRHSKYITFDGMGKIKSISYNGHKTNITYIRGKFKIEKEY